MQTRKWYFTFCYRHQPLAYKYLEIGGSFSEARAQVVLAIGEKWSFQYSPVDFDGQPEKYGLRQIDLKTARETLQELGESVPPLEFSS